MPSVSGAQLIFKGVSILLNRIIMKLNNSSLCLEIEGKNTTYSKICIEALAVFCNENS
jgi:hypothetical protein